jgi:hypothetical protein
VAEVDSLPARAIARAGEPPGRTRNRRERYDRRRNEARNTKDLLAAATDYFRATFAGYSAQEVLSICDRLVAHTDSERRRADGSQ